MNAVACATVEGGLNTRRCITTRMNSVTQKTGRAQRSGPLGQSDEPRGRRAMQFGLATVCVNQNVGVNGNHARSITS